MFIKNLKQFVLHQSYALILLVFVAFSAMVILSYLYISHIEYEHLERNVNNTLLSTQASIEADLKEPETFLASHSQTIRNMILNGCNANDLRAYFADISKEVLSDEKFMSGFSDFYGYFETFGGLINSGAILPNFDATKRSWYGAAIEAKGEVATVPPFISMLDHFVMTYSRLIFDKDSMPIGVIGLNVKLDRFAKYSVNTRFSEDSYGILLDQNLKVIAHPDTSYFGSLMRDVRGSELHLLAEKLERGEEIFERRMRNYKNELSIVFFRKIKNGWYLGFVTPKETYFQNLRNMMKVLVALGLVLFIVLSYFLLRMRAMHVKAERQTQLRTQAMLEAEAANKAKSKFLAIISHEIRTPMNAILGITEIQLQNETHSIPIKEAFNKIYSSGDMLIGIINDILDLSRIEMNKMEINSTKYEVASLINDAVHLNMMRNSKPIEFTLKVDENIPTLLFGDELRIKQILNNLLSNAYKYTSKGSVELSVNVETDNAKEGYVQLVFRINDTGQGMTEEQIERLFTTEYTRFNLETNRSIEGIGLGLSITWHLVKIMDGTISVESKPNEGTNFTVCLPQKTINSEVLGKELVESLENFRLSNSMRMKRAQIMREYMPYGKVLIVDDVDSNLYVAKGLMMPYGLSIDVAASGIKAVEKIKAGNIYDVVFMDHMMPKMDGMEATKIIRDMGYKEPIIALTANAVIGQANIFLENGFDEFIPKPIDIRQLNAILNKFIRDKQSPEVIAEARKQKESISPNNMPQSDEALHSVFLLDIKKILPVIENTLKDIDNATNEDLRMFTIGVHSMKSSLANIGETTASELAFALEKAGKERDVETIEMQTPMLIENIRNIKAKIEAKKKKSEPEHVINENLKFLHEQLQIICSACANYDERAIKIALEALKKISWKEETNALIDAIDEQLLYGDFEEICKLATERNNPCQI
ncbi:MAG: response regulator [Fibromonadaceae bacterium]|jgi:signal transduction histidine kinase/DNA-binding NarL/FixJ family response regulator|nr:response regulator [Fibromonadaceae bacterium]